MIDPMLTTLYTPCYLDGKDDRGNSRLIRNIRYLKYYRQLKKELGFFDICLADNGSQQSNIDNLFGLEYSKDLKVIQFENIKGGRFAHDYPYCWRALYFLPTLIDKFKYKKIINIDSDGFVLSSKLANFIRECDSGWHTLWCKQYGFPEASVQIICEDAFPILREYTKDGNIMRRNGTCMETALPYTHIHKEFDADRYGENRILQVPGMDYYGQAPLDIELKYEQ